MRFFYLALVILSNSVLAECFIPNNTKRVYECFEFGLMTPILENPGDFKGQEITISRFSYPKEGNIISQSFEDFSDIGSVPLNSEVIERGIRLINSQYEASCDDKEFKIEISRGNSLMGYKKTKTYKIEKNRLKDGPEIVITSITEHPKDSIEVLDNCVLLSEEPITADD